VRVLISGTKDPFANSFSHLPRQRLHGHRADNPAAALRGRIGDGAASLMSRVSEMTSQHAGWAGDAGNPGHRDSLADGVPRDVRVTPK
jgi:hypothetical protein